MTERCRHCCQPIVRLGSMGWAHATEGQPQVCGEPLVAAPVRTEQEAIAALAAVARSLPCGYCGGTGHKPECPTERVQTLAAMRSFEGEVVTITLDYDDPSAKVTGQLRAISNDGEAVYSKDGQTFFAWPCLAVTGGSTPESDSAPSGNAHSGQVANRRPKRPNGQRCPVCNRWIYNGLGLAVHLRDSHPGVSNDREPSS